jgi:hypothetical protein
MEQSLVKIVSIINSVPSHIEKHPHSTKTLQTYFHNLFHTQHHYIYKVTMKTSFILALILSATAILGSAIPEAHYRPDGSNAVTGGCTQCIASPNNCDITAPCASFINKLYCAW